MTVAIFVEGGFDPPRRGGVTPIEELWLKTLLPGIGCASNCFLVPISKKTIVALDPANPPMSGSAEAFDELFLRTLAKRQFDRALVAWDLIPAWNPSGPRCRRTEVLDFYRHMAASTRIGAAWKQYCHSKYQALAANGGPAHPQALGVNEIGVVVMEPMFEDLLIQTEAGFRAVVGVGGQPRARNWPTSGWGGGSQKPDSEVVAPAIASLRSLRPRVEVVKRIQRDFRTAKNEWAEFLIRGLLADPNFRQSVVGHPLPTRVRALVP